MNRLTSILTGLAGSIFLLSSPGLAAKDVSPFELYGDRISFTVLRNGKDVGTHDVRFKQTGKNLVVTSRFDLKIRALAINFYKYNYTSIGKWRNGKMVQLDTDVFENGEKTRVQARAKGNGLAVVAPTGPLKIKGSLYPTTHWNPNIVKSSRVFNTITGQANKVRIKSAGKENVPTERGSRPATRYVYSGDLQTEAWYDGKGRWVKLRFKADDGSTIEFVCKRCLGKS